MSTGRVIEDTVTADRLIELPLFKGECSESIEWLLEKMEERWLQPEDILLEPGDNNTQLFLILDGKIRIELDNSDEGVISILSTGECVGEISVLDGQPTSAYVIAHEPCRLLVIERDDIWKLIDNSHAVAKNLLFMLSSRIRNNNSNLNNSIQLQRHYEQNARTDILTGLYNRRWNDEMLPRLIERCRIGEVPMGLLMIDVDHFKQYNDSYGHQAGDEALRATGKMLLSHLRPNDSAVRFGGEEFLLLLPSTEKENVVMVAERLCQKMSQMKIIDQNGEKLPSITISVGAVIMNSSDTVDSLIAAADKALYRAKEMGRDRVVFSDRLAQ
ncbi:MAG: GGDEF domain-containing protein [Gammaproteobacteria bacterium]|nr:GGDEF domain-containing protein [Gammaproteobacteria bacterium]